MLMRFRLITYLVAMVALTFVVGCDEENTVLTNQRNAIERYLTGSHSPKLESRKDAELSGHPDIYDVWGLNTYRYIATPDADREGRTVVERGDEITLTFTAYIFTGGAPRNDAIYYTNEPDKIQYLVGQGLDSEYWLEEPLVIKLGHTDIIKGLARALDGCREGDRVEVYMTYEAAYEKNAIGTVPKESSVAWFFTIDSVVKGS